MFRRMPLLLGIVLLFLTACNVSSNTNSENSDETINFLGESDNWSAELEVQHTDKEQERAFELKYKGEDVTSVAEVDYKVEEAVGTFDHSGAVLNKEGIIVDKGQCNGCAFITESSEITVTVKWKGETETFLLEND